MSERIARCACGQLTVACTGDPVLVSICNCTECQRRTGSAFGVGAYFAREAVTRIEGAAREFTRVSDAGRWLKLRFCPECGSTVYWTMVLWPDRVGVAVGAFADPAFPAPQAVVWTESKISWAPLPAGVPAYERTS